MTDPTRHEWITSQRATADLLLRAEAKTIPNINQKRLQALKDSHGLIDLPAPGRGERVELALEFLSRAGDLQQTLVS